MHCSITRDYNGRCRNHSNKRKSERDGERNRERTNTSTNGGRRKRDGGGGDDKESKGANTLNCIVPFQPIANHSFFAVLPIDGKNVTLRFRTTYNELVNFWFVDISKNDEVVAAGVPLIPAENILEQLRYLEIGAAYVLPKKDAQGEYPNADDLADSWEILWSDTP